MATARPRSSGSARPIDDRVFIMCGLAWGAGLVHCEAAIEHAGEYVVFAACFAILATVQLLWGIAVYRSPAPRLLYAGAVASLMVAALWIVSRTTGLPVGPERWTPERVGVIDSVATADEVVLALLVVLQLRPGLTGAVARAARGLATAAALCLILVSSLALVVAGQAHGH